MYKVGDEVLIKGEVIEVMNDVPYPVRVRLGSDNGGLVFTNDEVCYADKIVKTYEMGLNDAWELAKKIASSALVGGMSANVLKEIFKTASLPDILSRYTAEEALAKIEAYEKGKKIKVGDVVEDEEGTKALVIDEAAESTCFVFTENGCVEEWYKKDLKKTGKKIPISGLLRQIGE